MEKIRVLTNEKLNILKAGRVFVPSPLALTENLMHNESYQRLLTLYYIKSGAAAVIPGAHTGEFSMGNLEIYRNWLTWVKEMTLQYGDKMLLIAAVSGENFLKQVEMAVSAGYDLVLIAPSAFSGRRFREVIDLVREIASMIPSLGFELQRSIPGAYEFSPALWDSLFEITYGAKGASFNTYRSLVMLEAAARSFRKDQLVMLTGNDDRIVGDLCGEFGFMVEGCNTVVRYHGGLLGHLATDTHAAAKWIEALFKSRQTGQWNFPMNRETLANAVNRCNMALFDALGDFENSVWGVKYRLFSQGLLPGPYCAAEKGRSGQKDAIDKVYGQYPEITDDQFLREKLESLKREVGIREV